MAKTLIFSLNKEHFKFDTFRSGGKGGQNQNKRDTGVRCTHPPSGAVGVARDERTQWQNKKLAFRRCVQSKDFFIWAQIQSAKHVATSTNINTLEIDIPETDILVEVKKEGKWVRDS